MHIPNPEERGHIICKDGSKFAGGSSYWDNAPAAAERQHLGAQIKQREGLDCSEAPSEEPPTQRSFAHCGATATTSERRQVRDERDCVPVRHGGSRGAWRERPPPAAPRRRGPGCSHARISGQIVYTNIPYSACMNSFRIE